MDAYLEIGKKKVFACAVDWPGWCRAAKTEEGALEALATYADRYREVAGEAGVRFPARVSFDVVERVAGDATTDFGAPGTVPELDRVELTPAQGKRLAALVEAAWTCFDRAAARAPAELRKGPRGGGRDTAAIVDHVVEAERSYARSLGLRGPRPDVRADILDALRRGQGDRWPARYGARRIAWHVLDHQWEIEDRSH